MKTLVYIILCVALFGCKSTPDWSLLDDYENLLSSNRYHEAFLFWPIAEIPLKEIQEGGHGLANYLLFQNAANCGHKDWVAIFKDPKIPFNMKEELVTMIHECAIKDGHHWDEMEISGILKQSMALREEELKGGHESMHEKILAYLEHSSPVSDKEMAIKQFSDYLDIHWGSHVHTRKGEYEFPFILMDYRIPLGIKERLMYLLHIYGIENK